MHDNDKCIDSALELTCFFFSLQHNQVYYVMQQYTDSIYVYRL
jgi:DMSO/TMAO reductase YedYZ heme-binding membrane subunit